MRDRITPTVESIAVIGAGTMGHGIAQVAAGAGYRVILRDLDRNSLARGIQAIERNLVKGMQLGKLTEADRDETLQHIRGTTRLEEALQADLIVEAAPEKLELKQEILRQLDDLAKRPYIFASNTSSERKQAKGFIVGTAGKRRRAQRILPEGWSNCVANNEHSL